MSSMALQNALSMSLVVEGSFFSACSSDFYVFRLPPPAKKGQAMLKLVSLKQKQQSPHICLIFHLFVNISLVSILGTSNITPLILLHIVSSAN